MQIAEGAKGMELNKYQEFVQTTAAYPNRGDNIIYPVLGLCGEAGEVSEKIKKLWRDDSITEGNKIPSEKKLEIVKELGDVLWYVASIASEIGYSLESVASANIEKLLSRKQRGTLSGSGDNR